MRQSGRHNSRANGGAERAVQAARKQARTLMLQVNKKLDHNLKPGPPFLAWLPRHAARLYNRRDQGGHQPRALREDPHAQ
eukprot:1595147-Pyramimonas_sp.AAC.1